METDTLNTEREKVAEQAMIFALLLSDPNLSETEIDTAIEELRPLRMKMRAIGYGSAPGFRNYDIDINE